MGFTKNNKKLSQRLAVVASTEKRKEKDKHTKDKYKHSREY